jgi:hypothetical protein
MYVDRGKYRGLVRFCGVMRWTAGLLCVPRGDEGAVGRLVRDTLRRRILHVD